MKVEIRPHKVSDAKRLYEIISDKEYVKYVKKMGLPMRIFSFEQEVEFLKKSVKDYKTGFTYGHSILADGKIVGAIGMMVNQHRKYIGEVGYMLDRTMWGKGITTKALKLINKKAFTDWDIKRIELVVNPLNKSSIRVAEKAGYKLEGKKMNAILTPEGKLVDGLTYSLIPPKKPSFSSWLLS